MSSNAEVITNAVPAKVVASPAKQESSSFENIKLVEMGTDKLEKTVTSGLVELAKVEQVVAPAPAPVLESIPDVALAPKASGPVAGPIESVPDTSETVAPIKVENPLPVAPPVTPAKPVTQTEPVVKWGRWNPAAGAGAIPLAQQVGSEYALIASNSHYAVTRLANYAQALPSVPAVYNFNPGTSEAYIREKGQYTPAAVNDAKLKITINNSESANFATDFNLTSDVYSGNVSATGTVSKDGVMLDDRQNIQTVIRGAAVSDGTSINSAAFGFYKSIDATKEAFGGIDWQLAPQ